MHTDKDIGFELICDSRAFPQGDLRIRVPGERDAQIGALAKVSRHGLSDLQGHFFFSTASVANGAVIVATMTGIDEHMANVPQLDLTFCL